MPSYSFNAPLIAGKKGDKGDKGDTGAGVATTNMAGGRNWFDKNNYLDNTQIASTGALNPASSGFRTSLLIPVTPGEVWTLSGMIATSAKRYRWVGADGTTVIFTGSSLFPQPNTLTAPANAYYFQFTFKRNDDSGSTSWDNAQFEKGAVPTAYQAYTPAVATIDGVPIRNARIDVFSQAETIALVNNTAKIPSMEVLKNGNTLYIRSKYNDTQSCVMTMNLVNANNIPVLTSVKIIGITETIVATGVQIHSFSDNTPPLQFNYMGNLGGSHGVEATGITATAHGKTSADVTARYIDAAGFYFRITEVTDSNNLVMLSEPYTAPGPEQAIKQSIVSPLTYVSGGVSTSNINFTLQGTVSKYPTVKNITVTMRADGKAITADGTYYCDLFELIDTHDVIDPSAMTFTAPQIWNNAAALATLNLVYAYRPNACMQLDTTINVLRDHLVTNFGMLQVQKTTIAGSLTNRFVYMPNITGKVVGGNTYNFVNKIDMSNDPPSPIFVLPADLTDPTMPTEMQVQVLTDGALVPRHVHAHGYDIQSGVGKYSERLTNNQVWYHSDVNKSYPRAYAGKLTAGDVISATAYSNYLDATINPTITNWHYITQGTSKILFIDAHQSLTKTVVKLDKELHGRMITVLYKTPSVTIHTADKVMAPGITISVSGGYGRMILKLT